MGPKWILWLLVIFANPLLIFARSGRITFQKFELPALTPSIEEILENEKIGGKFIELWRSAMEMSTEFKVNYDENVKLTLLVPKDEAFAKVIGFVDHENDNNVNEAEGLPDPFLMDFQLTQRVVTNHIIAQFSGGISILNDGGQLNTTSIGHDDLVFEKKSSNFYVNDVSMELIFEGENLNIFSLADLLVDLEGFKEAGESSSSMIPPVKTLAEMGDLLPLLEPRMSFGLRQVNAHLFGTIWRQTKHELQILKAKETSNLCNLPKEIGPCRGLQARFFFNSDSGTCEPFAFGGCDGNANNFQSLKDCANNCIKDQIELDRIRAQICQLPIQQFQGIRQARKQCQASKKYHFDVVSRSCLLVEYSGCFGTDNLFENLHDCDTFCGNQTDKMVDEKPPKRQMTIFAPEDDAIIGAIEEAGLDINDHYLFARDPLLGLRFLLKHISLESCDNGTAVIKTLDSMAMNCSALKLSGNRLDGIDYTLVGLTNVPFPISPTETRFYAAPTEADKYETEKRLKFVLATAALPVFPANIVPKTQPFSHFYDNDIKNSLEDSSSSIVCSLSLARGTRTKTSVKEERFHFDKDLGFCKKFSYEGQGGNLNNFKSSQECKEICGDFKGLVNMVSLSSPAIGGGTNLTTVTGGLAITQANSNADVWMFGAIAGEFDGLYLVQNAQPHHCQDLSGTLKDGVELQEMAALNDQEVLIRVPDFSLYGYDGRAMIVAVSRNGSEVKIQACGVIEKSSYPRSGRVQFESGEKSVLTQEGPWDLLDISSFSSDCKSGEVFSFYANQPKPNCIEEVVEENGTADEWPKDAEAIIRGPKGISGTLSLTQHSMDEALRAYGSIIGLEKDKEYRLSIHEPGPSSSNCMAAGNLFNPLRHDYQGISTKILGDLGTVDVGTNHAAYVDKESELSLVGGLSVVGKVLVISVLASSEKVACGFIQTHHQINHQVISAEAIIDHDDILGKMEFSQQGPKDFVHISGYLFGLHNESFYGFSVVQASCENISSHLNQASSIEKADFIEDFQGAARYEINTVAKNNATLIGKSSIIGQSLVLFEDNSDILACSPIKRTLDLMPEVCQSPEVSHGNVCLFSDFAWSYDAKLAKCILVKTAQCPHASKNQFATQAECMETCPVVPKYVINLVPSKESWPNWLRNKTTSTTESYEEFRRKFLLCHTVFVHSENPIMETMCGEKLNLQRSPEGWYFDDEPIFSVNHEDTWYNLYINRILTGNGVLV